MDMAQSRSNQSTSLEERTFTEIEVDKLGETRQWRKIKIRI